MRDKKERNDRGSDDDNKESEAEPGRDAESRESRPLAVPGHLAVIMDGNGRWAKKRHLPRLMGHRAGLKNLERMTRVCDELGVRQLTVFAFSSENWRRPPAEVKLLMRLLSKMLDEKVSIIHENGGRVRFLGSREGIPEAIVLGMEKAERLTADNPGMRLNVAVNYGGRWDLVNAVKSMLAEGVEAEEITEERLAAHLCLADEPPPDLLIRTGGEMRVSNFMLWQLAYTEYYFTDTHWPDFDERELVRAFDSFSRRERRFGRTSEQLEEDSRADASRDPRG